LRSCIDHFFQSAAQAIAAIFTRKFKILLQAPQRRSGRQIPHKFFSDFVSETDAKLTPGKINSAGIHLPANGL
jgi:hypothetical protein